MKVTNAELAIMAVKPDQYPIEEIPEVAFAGRSNVGKSSLLNKLINRRNLARTSSKPGKTQTINFYDINNKTLHLVDLPGYGYAKVSKSTRETWGEMIETYLTTREQLMAIFMVVDLRHPPTKDDIAMYEWIKHFQLPNQVIATKYDKIPKSQIQKHVKQIREGLGMAKGIQPIVFSAETGYGKDEVWQAIFQAFHADEVIGIDTPTIKE